MKNRDSLSAEGGIASSWEWLHNGGSMSHRLFSLFAKAKKRFKSTQVNMIESDFIKQKLVWKGCEDAELLTEEEKVLERASQYNFANVVKANERGTALWACGLSSWALLRYLDYGCEHGYIDCQVHAHNMVNINPDAGRHAFLTVRFPSWKIYILDNTFSQFLNNNYRCYEWKPFGDYLKKDKKARIFAERLIKMWYIELNKNNAHMYEAIIKNDTVRKRDVDIDKYMQDSDPSLREEYDESEFRSFWYEPLSRGLFSENVAVDH